MRMEYKREVLVPYLTELYGIEVTWHTLNNKCKKYQEMIQKDQEILAEKIKVEGVKLEEPSESKWKKVTLINLGILIALFILMALMNPEATIGYIAIGMILAVILYKPFMNKWNAEQSQYQKNLSKYYESCNTLKTWKEEISETEKKYPIDLVRQEELLVELKKCAEVRNGAYSIDIIPKQYRNLGAIMYLYEYFSTSKATDLDNIIQTMILSDVNKRIMNMESQLNQIISNQKQIHEELSEIHQTAESIYNQTVQISGQLTSIELTLDEQKKDTKELTDEIKMVRANTDISAYLQMGTYLKTAEY